MAELTEEHKKMIDDAGVGIITENRFLKILFLGYRAKDIRSAQITFFSLPKAVMASFLVSNIIYLLFTGKAFLNMSAVSGVLISFVTVMIYIRKYGFDKSLYLKNVGIFRIIFENIFYIITGFMMFAFSYLMLPDVIEEPNIYLIYVLFNPIIYVSIMTLVMSQFLINCLRLCKNAY